MTRCDIRSEAGIIFPNTNPNPELIHGSGSTRFFYLYFMCRYGKAVQKCLIKLFFSLYITVVDGRRQVISSCELQRSENFLGLFL